MHCDQLHSQEPLKPYACSRSYTGKNFGAPLEDSCVHSVGWLMSFEARSSEHLKADFDLERKVSKPSRRMLCAFFPDKPVANPQNFENLSADLAGVRSILGGLDERLSLSHLSII